MHSISSLWHHRPILLAALLSVQGFVVRRPLVSPPNAYYHSTRLFDSTATTTTTTATATATTRSDVPLAQLVNLPNFTLAATPEDCLELKEGQRLVCMGDVHGDLIGLENFLKIAGVMDKNAKSKNDNDDDDGTLWTGGNTILVQCGDVLDRGFEELACYSLLSRLSHEAQQQGGKVILLYGNHEAMNALGLFQYTTNDQEYEQVVGTEIDRSLQNPLWRAQYVGNQPARWATYEPGGLLAHSLMANMKVAVQVGKTVCVHAGLTEEHLKDYNGISGMNQQAKEWITAIHQNVTFNNDGSYSSPNQSWKEAEARQTTYLNTVPPFLGGGIGAPSPIWMRDYSAPSDGPPGNPMAQLMIEAALKQVDCDRMIMGHTPQQRINAALDGKAWRVDVGVSKGVLSGTPEVLEVTMVNGAEEISILTQHGKIPAKDRQTHAMVMF